MSLGLKEGEEALADFSSALKGGHGKPGEGRMPVYREIEVQSSAQG